jgi:hypothetical protein
LEKNKVWVIGREEEPIAVCSNEADAEELFMDLVMEEQYATFCWNWLYFKYSMEISLKYSKSNHCYWIDDIVDWR